MGNKEYIVNWEIGYIPSVKKFNTLVFEDVQLSQLEFYVSNTEKVFICKFGDKIINLKDYSNIKYAKTIDNTYEYVTTDLISSMLVTNINIYDTPTKNKINGTKYNDTVNLTEFIKYDTSGKEVDDSQKKVSGVKVSTQDGADTVVASKYADTITTGNGDDTIYCSLGNDKITGGKGLNKVIYYGKFDTDTITLTKTEQLTLDLSSYGLTKLSDLKFNLTSKNLEIKLEDGVGVVYGTIILKNFKNSNVVGANGKVLLDIGLAEPFDLNTAEFLSWSKDNFSTKGVFNGSRFSETIDASDVDTAYGKNNKGVTIKAGAGYNTIIGTNGFNDTITGGNDGNHITVGSGTNKITTGNGTDEIYVNGGVNTIKTGKGDDFVSLNGVTSANVSTGAGVNDIKIFNSSGFGNIVINEEKVSAVNNLIFTNMLDKNYALQKKGNDLIIRTINEDSSITIKNYYSSGKKFGETNFYINDKKYTFDEIADMTNGFIISGKGNITGTDGKDIIIANDFTESKVSNDKITPHKGNDIVNAGKGNNSIFINKGDGEKTIIDGGGVDTLVFPEGTKLNFNHEGNNMILTYGEGADKVIIKDYFISSSVKYVQIGDTVSELEHSYTVLTRGADQTEITLKEKLSTNLVLTNGFDNETYYYTLKATSGTQTIKLEYLANGRLVVDGDYLEINANDGQKDNLILLGDHNSLNTGDMDDIVRVGYVVDAKGYEYKEQSDYNVINTGSGNDYITYFGLKNDIDAGAGDDKVFVIGKEAVIKDEDIQNAETIRKNDSPLPVNNQINWFNQGEGGGDCRLFALFNSLSKSKDFSLDDYVNIVDNSNDTYTVTFKNYNHTNNSKTVALSDLTNFTNVYGDLDMVLIDYALNQLIYENKDMNLSVETVQTEYYNTIAEYVFGLGPNMVSADKYTGDITITAYTDKNFDTRLYQLWNLHQNGSIDNITVGLQPKTPWGDDSNYKLGVLTAHAYSLGNLTEEYITLINPWDNADCVTLDYSYFKTLDSCVIVYGIDFYNEYMLVDNGYTSASNNDFDSYIFDISAETANWLGANVTDCITVQYADENNPKITDVLCVDSSSDIG